MPTPRGWAVVAAAPLCYLGAWLLGYPELSVLGTGCLAALLLGRLAIARRVPLDVRRDIAPARVVRGEQALGVVTVVNPSRWRTRAMGATDRCGATSIPLTIPRLRAHDTRTQTYFLPTTRRGVIPVGPLWIVAADPLGLFRRRTSYGTAATLLVQPRTVELEAPPSGRASSVEGPSSRAASAGTVTFHALREYVAGDDLRHIHWRTTARTGALMVRQLVDSSQPRTTVLVDNRRTCYADEQEFELAVDATASVALAAARRGFPVSVVTAEGPLFSAEGGRAEATEVLERLAMVQLGQSQDLAGRLDAVRPGYGGGSLTVVSGALEAAELDRLAGVRGYFDRTVLVRVGAALPLLPAALPVTAIDAAELTGFAAAWRRAVASP